MNRLTKAKWRAIAKDSWGESKPDYFLRWWGRETFFDKQVQKILNDWRANLKPEGHRMCIEAWGIADNLALASSNFGVARYEDYLVHFPRHAIPLLEACRQARAELNRRLQNPKTALDYFVRWRSDRYLRETSRMNPLEPPKNYSLQAQVELKDQYHVTLTEAAIRKAVHDENKHRRNIMFAWLDAWLDYFGLYDLEHLNPTARELARGLRSRSNMPTK